MAIAAVANSRKFSAPINRFPISDRLVRRSRRDGRTPSPGQAANSHKNACYYHTKNDSTQPHIGLLRKHRQYREYHDLMKI
jgi:hypothetical protein